MRKEPALPGAFARAWRSLGAFISGRLVQMRILIVQAGMWEDRDLNVIAFNGSANMTVSVHTALAGGYRAHDVRLPPAQRRWWGCVGCRALSFLVQKSHCWCVMNDVPMAAQNMVRALLCISWVLFGPLLIHIWNVFVFQSLVHWWAAFVVDAAVLIPFIVAEQVGRWRSR